MHPDQAELLLVFFNPHQKIHLLLLEKKEGRKREEIINVREEHQSFASHTFPDRGLNPQPRYVPWLESNYDLSVHGATLPPPEPHQPGPGWTSISSEKPYVFLPRSLSMGQSNTPSVFRKPFPFLTPRPGSAIHNYFSNVTYSHWKMRMFPVSGKSLSYLLLFPQN